MTPKFDPSDPKLRSRLEAGAYVEPIFELEVVDGNQRTLVWVSQMPGGSAGWHHDVLHRAGAWPLTDVAQDELEMWFDDFASVRWPTRMQVFPGDFRPRS